MKTSAANPRTTPSAPSSRVIALEASSPPISSGRSDSGRRNVMAASIRRSLERSSRLRSGGDLVRRARDPRDVAFDVLDDDLGAHGKQGLGHGEQIDGVAAQYQADLADATLLAGNQHRGDLTDGLAGRGDARDLSAL